MKPKNIAITSNENIYVSNGSFRKNPCPFFVTGCEEQYMNQQVKPNSVLRLGKVFFIVLNSTIYNLLKAHKQCHQNSHAKASFQRIMLVDRTVIRETQNQPRLRMPKFISKYRNSTYLDFEEKPQEDSTSENRPSNYKECRSINTNTTAGFPRKNDSELDYNCMEEVITLKSCLRKQDSVRKLLQLKVSFNLPVKDEEQRRAVHATRAEVSSNRFCSSRNFCAFYKPRFNITRFFLFLS
ncbi:hypothetical protein D5086_005588 [Populus alba]|uniref:Uncharacterized protein n=1 Tax=Populus alba TaxID=43335 RepID=A0ACC4CTM5_POPAL